VLKIVKKCSEIKFFIDGKMAFEENHRDLKSMKIDETGELHSSPVP
jgi:hypothetical protein